MGVGAQVKIYRAGRRGQPESLLGQREIAVGYGWCSGQEAVAHFGLAAEERVDVEAILPHRKGVLVQEGVAANQRITVIER